MSSARKMATCAMVSALSVVLMLLGAVLELGMYAAPMLAGLLTIPVGKLYGRKYQCMVWICVSVLCFMLIPHVEQNLIYFGLLGWYPIVRPSVQKLPKLLGYICKFLIFNGTVIVIESLVMLVLVPEAMTPFFTILLLIVANFTFIAYDSVIPRIEQIFKRARTKSKRK